jgi:MoaD family protein
MRIKVRFLGAFAEAVRSKEETCELASPFVRELVKRLIERHGEGFRLLAIECSTDRLRPGVTLLVNGQKQDLKYSLSDGDEVTLLTPLAGG